jgi:hypothetical protein
MTAAVQRGQTAAGGSRELGDRDLEAQVAAARGQPGEDHVDDVAIGGANAGHFDELVLGVAVAAGRSLTQAGEIIGHCPTPSGLPATCSALLRCSRVVSKR